MKHFFTTTRRYQDIWEADWYDGDGPFEYTELRLAVPLEDFLLFSWHWQDLLVFVTGGEMRKILWITENAFLVVEDDENPFDLDDDTLGRCIDAEMQAKSGQKQTLTIAHLYDAAISTGEVALFWRAVATSKSVKLTIHAHDYFQAIGLPPGPILSQFFRGSLSLQHLMFNGLHFEEEHCRALATLQRTDLTVEFTYCAIETQDAQDIFIEWFRHNQVVTELNCCEIDSSMICALSGNNSLKKLTIEKDSFWFGEEEMRSLLQALPGNMGIEHLTLTDFQMTDEAWSLLFRSLATHPRMNFLSINYSSFSTYSTESNTPITIVNAILKMLLLNTVVYTIDVPPVFNNEELYQNSIIPRLEMNRSCFEVQRQALKRADPSVRPQLLGRALHVVRYNPNLVFQFLLENVPAFVRTEEEEDVAVAFVEQNPIIATGPGSKRKAPS
jgi:hypothetical protein